MTESSPADKQAPWPGSPKMPRWNLGTLTDAPIFSRRNLLAMIGPGLVMGASAIGGGEWLAGPRVTARYGGELMWLTTISILCQVLYNIEISRYTLYSGEPIFSGKFRIPPGPMLWVFVYLLLDMGSVFPYLAGNAAGLVQAMFLGSIPRPEEIASHWWWNKITASLIFGLAVVPLIFGGKVYNSLKVVMSAKLVIVIGFLMFLSVFYSRPETWKQLGTGFFKFGNVPVTQIEDKNGNGVLDAGEDWDKDGKLDVVEMEVSYKFDTIKDEKNQKDATDLDRDGKADQMVDRLLKDGKTTVRWPDLDQDGKPDATFSYDSNGDGKLDGPYSLDGNDDEKLDKFIDIDRDGIQDGDNVENVFVSLGTKGTMPKIDFSLIAIITALAAIAGNGGLTNTPISNFTRDQGWGMGKEVGAIPSLVGGQDITLSHVGSVFEVTEESYPRWKRWVRHVARDQICVWMVACFIGVALPSMLSVEFLKRGTRTGDEWSTATLTAGGVAEHVSNAAPDILASQIGLSSLLAGPTVARFFWGATLFVGFLVLFTSLISTIDGVIRRWVDVFWTASARLRKMPVGNIRYVYFGVLISYVILGTTGLWFNKPDTLLKIGTILYNFALGASSLHTLFVNSLLLPVPLRPNKLIRCGLAFSCVFFWTLGTVATLRELGMI